MKNEKLFRIIVADCQTLISPQSFLDSPPEQSLERLLICPLIRCFAFHQCRPLPLNFATGKHLVAYRTLNSGLQGLHDARMYHAIAYHHLV